MTPYPSDPFYLSFLAESGGRKADMDQSGAGAFDQSPPLPFCSHFSACFEHVTSGDAEVDWTYGYVYSTLLNFYTKSDPNSAWTPNYEQTLCLDLTPPNLHDIDMTFTFGMWKQRESLDWFQLGLLLGTDPQRLHPGR